MPAHQALCAQRLLARARPPPSCSDCARWSAYQASPAHSTQPRLRLQARQPPRPSPHLLSLQVYRLQRRVGDGIQRLSQGAVPSRQHQARAALRLGMKWGRGGWSGAR